MDAPFPKYQFASNHPVEVKLRYIFFATSHKIEAAAAIFESRLEAIMLEINILG